MRNLFAALLVASSSASAGTEVVIAKSGMSEITKENVASLAWIVPSFFLHAALHEGSHALAARIQGYKVDSLSLLPSSDGFLAHVDIEQPPGPHPLVAGAPLILETLWIAGAYAWSRHNWNPVLQGILRTEMLMSILDITVWMFGAFFRSPTADAAKMGWNPAVGSWVAAPVIAGGQIFTWDVVF